MIVARGRYWRADFQDGGVAVALQKAGLPAEFHELREARFDVPLSKWNLLVKNLHSDRKLLGGILLDFAKDKERVNLIVGNDRMLVEFRRCVNDATLALIEEELLSLATSESNEEKA